MLRSSVFCLLLLLVGCGHDRSKAPYVVAPEVVYQPVVTPMVEPNKPTVSNACTQTECLSAQEAETQTTVETQDATTQTETENHFSIEDCSEVESEYMDDEENEAIVFGESILMDSDHSQQKEPVKTPKKDGTPEISNMPSFSEENNSEHHSDNSWEVLKSE